MAESAKAGGLSAPLWALGPFTPRGYLRTEKGEWRREALLHALQGGRGDAAA